MYAPLFRLLIRRQVNRLLTSTSRMPGWKEGIGDWECVCGAPLRFWDFFLFRKICITRCRQTTHKQQQKKIGKRKILQTPESKSSYQTKFSITSSSSGRCEVLYPSICEMQVLLHFICQVTTNHATFSKSVCLALICLPWPSLSNQLS